jgi:uncharacterized protein (DUF608 family)
MPLEKPSRRDFLRTTSSAAIGSAVPAPAQTPIANTLAPSPFSREDLFHLGPQREFRGDRTTQIAVPIGGIGAGCICLNGYGGLQDFSIANRPATTALPEGFSSSRAGFAILHVKGSTPLTKLMEGPFPVLKIFDQGLQGEGYRRGGFEGFPRFNQCFFKGEFPLAHVELTDPALPLGVKLVAWNPFIPLDDRNSSIPCVVLEYTIHNSSAQKISFELSYHLSHLPSDCAEDASHSRNAVIPGRGVFLYNVESPNAEAFGTACVVSLAEAPRIKAMWLRSPGWEFDSLSALWREVSTGTFTENAGSNEVDKEGRNGGSILFSGELAPGQSRTYPIAITWHFPNAYLQVGGVSTPEALSQGSNECRTLPNNTPPPWRPFYAGVWTDAREIATYLEQNYSSLRARTLAFHQALFSSTLPPYVLDAVSANLAILKSPTVLRLENGDLWGWEGCFPDAGCCHGACTHVWNYAQAIPHLYPQLERTLRELEYLRSIDERGHVTFRSALPEGDVKHDFHAASDGQLGGIMKLYRDWQISGDTAWLQKMYPLAKRSLDYCIRTWDPEHRGALFEPHHNTYDIEFWGPDGMCTGIYLGALSALSYMAQALDRTDDEKFYSGLALRAARFLEQELFNGDYFQQKVQYTGLRNTSFAELVAKVDEHSSEMQQLLKREGPKYQYGSGCISDGVIGLWMARMYGIETPHSRAKIRLALQSIFKNNFKTDLSQHANAQRPGYAMGHEPGLLLCSWPRGAKPTLPFVYSDEVWTGIEYQVASHLIAEGLVEEGLTIVKATRSRYDGRVRNPWNEYECGNYYARAMSSYALLSAASGFRYSAVDRTLHFGPQVPIRPFRCFFSTALGFGTISLDRHTVTVQLLEGELPVQKLVFTDQTSAPNRPQAHTEPLPRVLDWRITIRPNSPAILHL